MKHAFLLFASLTLALTTACSGSAGDGHAHADGHSHDQDSHAHDGDGHAHGEDEPAHVEDGHGGNEEGHERAEQSLGTVRIGDLEVELAQGHGGLVAGKEGHLVVKLPYSDDGATVVRAWIGSKDRTLSYVGRGEYAAAHDDYDVHATAPDPLPADPKWWVDIERPDGTRSVGAAQPQFD